MSYSEITKKSFPNPHSTHSLKLKESILSDFDNTITTDLVITETNLEQNGNLETLKK